MRGRAAEVFVWGRGEYGRLGLGDRSGSSKLRATPVAFREPGTRVVQARAFHKIPFVFRAQIFSEPGARVVQARALALALPFV
jgi:hypothetical protein